MGFTFNGTHSDYFGICVKTKSIPYIAAKRQKTEEVQGRDGKYVFEDSYDNSIIKLACTISDYKISDRRTRARQISKWLANNGILVFDYEPSIQYRVVKVVNGVDGVFGGARLPTDDFDVTFECEPYQEGVSKNPLDERRFVMSNGQVNHIHNEGTYKVEPLIIVTGTASTVTIDKTTGVEGSFTLVNVNGTIYIDCKNKLVYSISGESKVNKMNSFTGDFFEFEPGITNFLTTGTISSLTVEFDYRNTYL